MLENLWRYRKPLLILILSGLVFYVLEVQKKDEDDYNAVDRIIVKLTGPIALAIDALIDQGSDRFRRYVANKTAADENERIRRDLAQTRRELKQLDEVRRENHRLLQMLSLEGRSREVKYLPARVIATSTSPLFKSVRIDRGTADGVVRGMGVVADVGVAGRVMAVDRGYADVMLLSDVASSIDIYVGRSRARGRLRGQGDALGYKARIDYLVRSAAVEVGDQVYTTGAGAVFPKGLLVGTVVSVNKIEHGLYQEALVEAAAPLAGLDELMVVLAFEPDAEVKPPTPLTPEEIGVPPLLEADPEDEGTIWLSPLDPDAIEARQAQEAGEPANEAP